MTTARKVIFDCDPGIDDAVALLLAFASPELDVLGLTAVNGNIPVEATAANALAVCRLAGRDDVPVYVGAHRPFLRDPVYGEFSGSSGLGNAALEAPKRRVEKDHAVDFLVRALSAAAARGEKITLCVTGPQTNIALALRHTPSVREGIERIVLMGGAFRTGGNRSRTAEFNILADPHAAAIVFTSGVPLTVLPLDATFQAMATPERVAALRAAGGKVAETVADILTFWDRKDVKRYGSLGGPLHDPLVPAWLIAPELFTSEHIHVEVECASELCLGQTVGDFWGRTQNKPNADVVMKVDADGFFALLGERLARYR